MSRLSKIYIPIFILRAYKPIKLFNIKRLFTKKSLFTVLFWLFIARGYYEMYQEIPLIRPVLIGLWVFFMTFFILIFLFGTALVLQAKYKRSIAAHTIDSRRFFIF